MSLGNIYLNLNKLDEAGRCFALALNSENPRTLAGAYHYLYLILMDIVNKQIIYFLGIVTFTVYARSLFGCVSSFPL